MKFAKQSYDITVLITSNCLTLNLYKSCAEKVGGQTVQRITIFYNCIEAFTVPERESIPEADVRLRTRKGVALSYSQAKAG